MQTTCDACGAVYDDMYRFTFCPHDEFEMCTTVLRADGQIRVCRSIRELEAFLEEGGTRGEGGWTP